MRCSDGDPFLQYDIRVVTPTNYVWQWHKAGGDADRRVLVREEVLVGREEVYLNNDGVSG
jgi:hypothetical protein